MRQRLRMGLIDWNSTWAGLGFLEKQLLEQHLADNNICLEATV